MFPAVLLRYLLHHRMEHLILHVTARCNLRCGHCFVDHSPQEELPLERCVRLAHEVGPFFWLDISGGEPFLRADLAEIIRPFRCKVVQIPTNGSLPDAAVEQVQKIRSMGRAALAVSISIDGLQATHDEIRGRPGSWKTAWETFARLKALGVPVKVNTVVMRRNLGEFLELMRDVRRRGPDFHSVILRRGQGSDPTFELPTVQELGRLGPDMFDILKTYDYGRGPITARILRNYHRYLWRVSLETLQRRRQVIPCLGGRAHMAIYADGSVCPCEMLPAVGNIKVQSWPEVLASPALRNQRKRIRKRGCWCTHNCVLLDSILLRLESFFPLLCQRPARG